MLAEELTAAWVWSAATGMIWGYQPWHSGPSGDPVRAATDGRGAGVASLRAGRSGVHGPWQLPTLAASLSLPLARVHEPQTRAANSPGPEPSVTRAPSGARRAACWGPPGVWAPGRGGAAPPPGTPRPTAAPRLPPAPAARPSPHPAARGGPSAGWPGAPRAARLRRAPGAGMRPSRGLHNGAGPPLERRPGPAGPRRAQPLTCRRYPR